VDYAPSAPVDEWSGDRGVGTLYLSQQCVFRLAPLVGIDVPASLDKAAQLEHVQGLLERGKEGAEAIWTSIGVYLGYAVAHYANFYDLKHVLILGRCTSGKGGGLIESIRGDYLAAVGLPLKPIAGYLESRGILFPRNVEKLYAEKSFRNWRDF